jgi:Fic family protein
MDPKAFQRESPGRLVPTTFEEKASSGTVRTVSGMAFVPDPLPPARLNRVALVGQLFEILDTAKTRLIRLEEAVGSLPDPNILLIPMRRREAQASSRIENTYSSLDDVALAEVDPSKASSDTFEVLCNLRAINLGLESPLPISTRLLCDMHKVLITDASKGPGKVRDRQVCIGDERRGFAGARFVPPPPEELTACLRDWELFVNPGALNAPQRERWPELIELAMAHYQIEAIHPFSDGNGRLGRALVNLTPSKHGMLKHPVCNLSEWIQAHRQEYYDGLLRVSTHADWESWLRFFCTAIAEQANTDLSRAARLRGLYVEYGALAKSKRSSGLLAKLVDQLFKSPVITIPLAAKVLGVTYPSAQGHVERLIESGVLRQLGEATYDKYYLAPKIIEAIQGDTGE